jgi:hypothetical protein
VEDEDLRLMVTIAGALLWLPFVLWNGYALSVVWAWHIAPLGAPVIGVLEAAGVALVFKHLANSAPHQEPDDGYLYRSLGWSALRPGLFIAFGWIIKVLG